MKMITKSATLGLTFLLALGACAVPGEESRPDVYDQSQVNTVQRGRVITILSVSHTNVTVDNSQNQRTASVVGGLLGAALSTGLASGPGHANLAGGLAAGAGGTAGGAILGSTVVNNTTVVDGVMIGYQDRAGGDVLFSTQVGRLCEYKLGSALVVTMGDNKTRVQPNASCPKK